MTTEEIAWDSLSCREESDSFRAAEAAAGGVPGAECDKQRAV